MNAIVNKFLLAGDKFMPEMHSKQLGFIYSACGRFTKNRKRIKKIKETGDSRYVYQNELDKACFQHDMAYGDFKNLNTRTAAEIVLRDKAFNIAKNRKYDGYQCGLASMVYKCFEKKASGGTTKNEIIFYFLFFLTIFFSFYEFLQPYKKHLKVTIRITIT